MVVNQLLWFYKSNKVMHIMPAAEYRRSDNVIFSITLKLGMESIPCISCLHLQGNPLYFGRVNTLINTLTIHNYPDSVTYRY